MKKIRNILLPVIVIIPLLAGCPVMSGVQAADNIIHVRNAKELFANIGPDRIIECAPGVYDVRTAQGTMTDWVFFRYSEPQIRHVKGLMIRGGKGVEIMNGRNEGYVLTFDDCRDITLESLTLGHEKDTERCRGGVVLFENSISIKIRACDIYGCGLTGIDFERVKNAAVSDTIVRDCTITALDITEGFDIRFDRCVFSGTEGYALFRLRRIRNLAMNDCIVKGNRSEKLIFAADATVDDVRVIRTRFENNTSAKLTDAGARIRFVDPVFTGNGFDNK